MNRLRDIVIICYCCIIAIEGNLTVGVLMSISYILGQLGGPIGQIQSLLTQYQMFKVSMARLSEVQRKENEQQGAQEMQIDKFRHEILFSEVSFKYEGSFSPNIFEGLSISFPANKMTAIVGNSGSGKTTLLKLIMGFYYPQKGKITIDETPLNEIDINSWRNCCGVVLQDGKIFSGTITENITLGSEIIDEKKIETVSGIEAGSYEKTIRKI